MGPLCCIQADSSHPTTIMSDNVNLSAMGLLQSLADILGLDSRKRLSKGALVALETVQPRFLSKYGVQVLLGLDSERVIEDWLRKGVCDDGITFPRPVEITKRIQRWDIQEVLDFMERKKAKRNQPDQRSPF